MLVVAVDPGLTGACAVLDQHGLRAVFDLPTMQAPDAGPGAKVQRKLDGRALVRLLREHCPAQDGRPAATIEKVATFQGKNHAAQTQDALLRMFGAIETALELLGWAPDYVPPMTWKRHYGLAGKGLKPSQRKTKALDCARQLYPQCNEIARAKDHNRAEAILIGHWWRQTQS